MTPDDVMPVSTPLFHTGGWHVFLTPALHVGGTVVLFDGFFPLRVFPPLAGTPVGPEGCPPLLLRPSPPPIGWSVGFIAIPLVAPSLLCPDVLPQLPV